MPTVFGEYYYGDPTWARRQREKREASRARKWNAMQDAMKQKRTTQHPSERPERGEVERG